MSIVRFLVLACLLANLGHPKAAIGRAFCTCGWLPCNSILEADAVFLATVDSFEVIPGNPRIDYRSRYVSVTLKDIEPLRGVPEPVVRNPWGGEAACGYEFQPGVRYLIHGYRDDSGHLWTGLCTRTEPSERATGLIEYLRDVDDRPDQSVVWGRVEVLQDLGAFARQDFAAALSPIEGARLTFEGPDEEATVETDREGRFRVTGLAYGPYAVGITLPEHLSFLTTRDPFEIELTSPHGCADLRFIAR